MKSKVFKILSSILALICMVSCSKKEPLPISTQASQSSSISAYQQILDEREKNSTKQPNVPSVCKNNPNGYLFIKIGDELFRTTLDSSIYINAVVPDHMRQHKKLETDIPEGCEGNPYIYPDAFIEIRHKQNDPEWQKIKFEQFFMLYATFEEQKNIYGGQDLVEHAFTQYKVNGKSCVIIVGDIEKCFSVNPDGSEKYPKGYQAKNYLVTNRPYTLDCMVNVGGALCMTGYRLYPSVNLFYSFWLPQNKKWDEKNIVLFDKYLRDLFESIRVKN